MKKIISSLTLIIFCAVFFAGCGSAPPSDYELKQAMVAVGRADSYQFDVTLTAKIDEKMMKRDEDSYADFFAYADGSSLIASNKIIFTDKSRAAGLISSDITYTWAKKDAAQSGMRQEDAADTYKFNVVTSFNFKNLEKNKPAMSLVQAFQFTQMPKRIWDAMGFDDRDNDYKKQYFTLIHSEDEVLKGFFKNMLAKSVPNWGEMLSTLNWRQVKKDYTLALTHEIIMTTARQMLDAFNYKYEGEDEKRVENLFDALEFNSTNLAYTVGDDGKLGNANWTFNGKLNYYKLSNSVLGRTNGFDIVIPIIAELDIKFSDWDAVEKFNFPALGEDITVSDEKVREHLPKVFPKRNPLQDAYSDDEIVVNINGKKVEFFKNYPPSIVDDKVYLPLKYMMQTRGGLLTAEQVPDGRWKATAKVGTNTANMLQNSKVISINGAEQVMSANIIVHWDYNTFYAPYELFKLAFDMDCNVDTSQKTEAGRNKYIFDFVSLEAVAGR
ncbi:MAG: hypothetical protein FWE47_03705 [Oscillospiraceae bacterium]|nr:hypothetical protein [Oscillospiraceae bacterium]